MNYGEEQKNELEALSEIYYNEIKVISGEQPISFSIKVRPQASSYEELEGGNNYEDDDAVDSEDQDSDDESETGEAVHQQLDISVELRFDLPAKYPDEKPAIQILDSNNLEEEELEELLNILSQKADESLGTVMIFMLVSDVVEWLITKTDKEADDFEQEKEKKQKEIEAEENKRFDGTPVTMQTFMAWKAKFEAEMLKAKLEQQKQQIDQAAPGSKGLTGREMFESDKTLAESDLNFVEDLDQNQIEALLQNIEEVDLDDDDGEDFELELDDEDEEFDLEDEEDSEDDEEEQTVDRKETKKTPKVSSKR